LITEEIDRGVRSFAQTMATFVCEQFYDNRIVPELARFRANGGKISDLRQRIHERCEAFRDEISAFASTAVKELETSVGPAVDRILSAVRQDFRFTATIRQDLLGDLEILPKHEFDRFVKPIGAGFTDAIGATISASIAVALGTLAGGFGESLEIAVVVALFGTTGPVGFLIGAVVGLIAGAGAWWLGRDKITEQIESISLPSTVVGMVLWQSRFDRLIQEGRVKCHDLVKTRVNELLSPLSSRIGSEVWTRLEELWNERRNRAEPASR
jgi:phage host-nuclease inhibitor protein Gam